MVYGAREDGGRDGGVIESLDMIRNGSRNGTSSQPGIFKGHADVIIVGAGVAGAALAHTLAKDGRRVHVIERDLSEQDRIVGELLQPGGHLKLVELGLEDCVDKIDSQRVYGYVLFLDGKTATLSYPTQNYASDVAGRGFHNGRFVQRLRQKAASHPNVKVQQGTVTSLIEENGTIKGVRYKTKADGDRVLTAHAPLTVVCDGCFSNLRRSLCYPKIEVSSYFVGVVLEDCELPFANHGHLILADPSPVIFYPISSTEVRYLVDVPGQKLPSLSNGDMAHYLKSAIAPQLPAELQKAFISAVDKGNIKSIPCRSMPATARPTPGAILLGDSLNMRHPSTGGGVSVALYDIVILRDLLRPLTSLNDSPALCTYLESFYIRRKPAASTINAMADALYKVISPPPDLTAQMMRKACFDYLRLRDIFTFLGVSLFSCLNPSPYALVLHFSAVAFFAVGRELLPYPSPHRLLISAKMLQKAAKIVLPSISAEGVREMFFPATVPAFYRKPPPSLTHEFAD
uniref:Squalene monooxygenase n=1 Tax=Kalanchoe fedtschenkoi TaxID=63787 RepID=A0A7N0T4V2_KALFE